MSSEQKDYKTEIINCFKSLALCVVPANRSMLRWQNEVIHAVISEHITRMRWRWYLYWHSYHAFFNKNVILWPYSDSSAVEVRCLRSGLHKWEFTHAQLTDVALWIDTSMIWVKLPYPLPLTSFLFYSILSMQPGNRDDNSDLQEWTLAAVWNVYPDCCVVSPSRLQNQHELHDLMVLITLTNRDRANCHTPPSASWTAALLMCNIPLHPKKGHTQLHISNPTVLMHRKGHITMAYILLDESRGGCSQCKLFAGASAWLLVPT